MPSSPACTVTSSPRSNSTSERLPGVVARAASRRRRRCSVSTPRGAEASRNVPEPAKTYANAWRVVSTGSVLRLPGRHRHVEVARIGGDAFHRPLLAPEVAAHHPHARAVVVGHLGDVLRRRCPGSAASVILSDAGRFAQSWKPCMRPCGSPFGISWWMMPLPAVIHCTSPAPMLPAVAQAVAVLDRAGEHVGDRLDAAVRMPREAGEVVRRACRCGSRRAAGTDRTPSCSPKPNARRRCTPAPSMVGLAWMMRLTGRMDMAPPCSRARLLDCRCGCQYDAAGRAWDPS